MTFEVLEVTGPSFLATAESGFVDGDEETLDTFLGTLPEGAYVVDVKRDEDGEGEGSWFGTWWAGDGLGHDLVTYICHRQSKVQLPCPSSAS